LCNPPFHQETTIGDFIAWQMFVDARRALKTGGVLRVIGNSHLGYHLKLKRIFGKSKIIVSNERFMIVEAVKTALK
jgi:16S rRNA G1207 methylase RsmC